MLKLITLLLTFVVSTAAFGQPRAMFMLGAIHADSITYCGNDPIPHKLNSFTPGIGIGYDFSPSVMAAGGVWKTSQGTVTGFAYADWRPLREDNVSAGLFAGVSGGYCIYENSYGPIGGLTVRADFEKASLHFLYIPEIGSKKNTETVGMGVSFPFK